jgi:hypothetical protein
MSLIFVYFIAFEFDGHNIWPVVDMQFLVVCLKELLKRELLEMPKQFISLLKFQI